MYLLTLVEFYIKLLMITCLTVNDGFWLGARFAAINVFDDEDFFLKYLIREISFLPDSIASSN